MNSNVIAPPEREVKDFYFKHLVNVRISPTSGGGTPCDRVSLLAVSNKYGLLFAGTPTGFKVLVTSEIGRRAAELEKTADVILEDLAIWAAVATEAPPINIAISSDDLTLSVCVKKNEFVFAQMFDVRSFANKGAPIYPFLEVRLSSAPGVGLLDLAWNPGSDFSTLLCTCMSDGSVGLWDVKDSLEIVASLSANSDVTCCCWSPKGKQVVVGRKDGSLFQLDQQLKAKKQIPRPNIFVNPMSVLNILWQSTHTFIAAYVQSIDDSSEPPTVVTVTVPKGANPSYVNYEDICFSNGEQRQHKYFLGQLPDWEVVVGLAANAVEAGVMGKSPENKNIWERWSLEDSGRAELPMTADFVETFPAGMAIDLTSQMEIPIDETQVAPPMPLFLLLSTDGILVPFYMVNINPAAVKLTVQPQVLSEAGARKPKGVPITQQPAAPVPTMPTQQPAIATYAMPIAPNTVAPTMPSVAAVSAPAPTKPPNASSVSKSLFNNSGTPAFGQPQTSKPTMTFGGFPNVPLNSSTPAKSLAFGQQPSSVPSSVDSTTSSSVSASQISFGKPLSQSTPAPNQTAPNDGGQKKPLGQGGLSGFGLGQNASGFSFNLNPSTEAKTSSQPQGAPAFSFAGGIGGKPPTTSFSFTAPAQPKAAESTAVKPVEQVTGKRGAGVSFDESVGSGQAIHRPSQEVTPKSVAAHQPQTIASHKPVPINVPSSQPTGTVPQPRPAPVTLPQKQVQPTSILKTAEKVPSSTVQPSQPGGSVHKRPSGPPKKVEEGDNPFLKSILDEMAHFKKELSDLRSRSGGINTDIGTREELQSLRKDTEHMFSFCKDVKDTTKSVHTDIHNLKSDMLEGFSLVEECKLRQQRQKDPQCQQLLKSRPLDPANAKMMKEIRTQYLYIDGSIREVDKKLDIEWENYLKRRSKIRRNLQAPVSDAIYTTLGNHHNIINNQARLLDKLSADLQHLKLYNTTSVLPARHIIEAPDNSRLFAEKEKDDPHSQMDRVLNNTLSPGPANNYPVSPEKQAKLREVLGKRRVTPVKSSAPGNLSMSKIVSADSLRRMLAEQLEESILSEPPRSSTPARTVLTPVRSPIKPRSPVAFPMSKGEKSPTSKPPATSFLTKPSSVSPKAQPITITPKPDIAGFGQQKPGSTVTSQGSPVSQPKPVAASLDRSIFKGFSGSGSATSTPTKPETKPTGGGLFSGTVKPDTKPTGGGLFGGPTGSIIIGQSKTFSSGTLFSGQPESSTSKPFTSSTGSAPSSIASPARPGFSFAKPPSPGKEVVKPQLPPSDAGTGLKMPPTAGFEAVALGLKVTTAGFVTSPFTMTTSTPKLQSGFNLVGSTSTATSASSKSSPNGFKLSGVQPLQEDQVSTTSKATPTVEDVTPPGTPKMDPTAPESESSKPDTTTTVSGAKPTMFQMTKPGGEGTSSPTPGSFFATVSKADDQKPEADIKKGINPIGFATSGVAPFTFGGSQISSGFSFGGAPTSMGGVTSAGNTSTVNTMGTTPTPASIFLATASSQKTSTTLMGTTLSGSVATGSITTGKPVFDTSSSAATLSRTENKPTKSSTDSPQLQPVQTITSSESTVTPSASTVTSTSVTTAVITAGTPPVPPGVASSGQTAVNTTAASTSLSSTIPGTTGTSTTPSSSTGFSFTTETDTSVTDKPTESKSPLFGGQGTSSISVFGGVTPASSTSTSIFGGKQIGAPTIFGGGQNTAATTTATSVSAVFGSTAATTTENQPLFGGKPGAASVFGGGQVSATTTTPTPTTTTTTGVSSAFGNNATTTTLNQSLFGNTTPSSAAPTFGSSQAITTTTAAPSIFGNATTSSAPGFGTSTAVSTPSTTQSSIFGQESTTSTTSGSGFGFGGQSVFGGKPAFGQSTFGQPASSGSSVFGGQGAPQQSVFGQSAVFGTTDATSSGSSFGQVASSTTTNGSVNTIGNGGFFTSLGGKPSAENVNKNVFGESQVFGGGNPTTGLFGQNAGVFGANSGGNVASSGFGGFGQQQPQSPTPSVFGGQSGGSGSFSAGGSVSSGGFGGFSQQQPQSPQPGGFGSPPSFGSPPAFGGAPSFGGGAFGGGPSFSNPGVGMTSSSSSGAGTIFGSSAQGDTGQAVGFAGFAQAGSPTFGSLAQQGNPPTFGGMEQQNQQQQQQQQQQQPNTFGGGTFGGSAFGGGSGFSSPGQGSSFSSYR